MNRKVVIVSLLLGASGAGIVGGNLICRSAGCRNLIGILCRRGHLLALAGGRGVYEADLQRALAESRYASGNAGKVPEDEGGWERSILVRLVANAVAQSLATHEKLPQGEVDHELTLARDQFADEARWRAALRRSGLWAGSVRSIVADELRTRQWIDRQIAPDIDVTADECRTFYNAHPEDFCQPVRFRASHLFLAAPPDTPAEIVDAKSKAMESLSVRLTNGEDLADLVAAASEDEATKKRGGDLGYFSATRMPADFFAAVVNLHVGEISKPIRTRLGFHIVQLTDRKPAGQLAFDQVRAEIATGLANRKRERAAPNFVGKLAGDAEWMAPGCRSLD